MQDQKIWNLIHRYLSGECSPLEEQRLHDWLAENPAHQEFFDAIQKVWQVSPVYDVEIDFDEDWKIFSERLGIDLDKTISMTNDSKEQKRETHHRAKQQPIKQLVRVAAILLIIAIPSYYFVVSDGNSAQTQKGAKTAMQNIQTARGERASMEFSDGSRVTLNSMSTVRFPKVFTGSRRELYLEGEAFFQVAHDDDQPFVVHANGVEVKVMGTEFNVNSYKENKVVEVVVKDGKVAVSTKESATPAKDERTSMSKDKKEYKEVILTKAQRTTIKPGELPTQPEDVTLSPYLAWVNGQMVFEGTPMREVIQKLHRAYNLHFEVTDTTLLSKRLKASFKRERLDKVLGIISFTFDINYEMHEDTVVFKSNQREK